MAKSKKRSDGYFKKTFSIDGKRYYVYAKSQKELFEKEKAKREEIALGFLARKEPTLNQYHEQWAAAREGTVKQATLRSQEKIYNVISNVEITSAKRALGEIKMKDITVEDLRLLQSELALTRSTQTVNDYLSFVGHIFRDATKERVIEYNPCVMINRLKRVEEECRDTSHRALTPEETTSFFSYERTKKCPYYNAMRLAVSTGLRVGEIGALKPEDVKKGVINVERTITRNTAGEYVIGQSAKTKAGKRSIPINDAIADILHDQMELNKMLYGLRINDTIFHASEGGLLVATPINREIKKICLELGIEPFTMHALRATFATNAIAAGINPKVVQELLGHASFNITMSLYGHALPDSKADAMEKMSIAI